MTASELANGAPRGGARWRNVGDWTKILAMDEPLDTPVDAESEPHAGAPRDPVPVAKQSFKRRHWGKLTFLGVVGIPAVLFAVWTAIALSWSYSSGLRAGYVQKVSRKGWVCKTWEGTLYTDIAKGFRSDSFQFTVRSDSIAHLMEQYSGRKVAINYEQHAGVPTSCFGDTEYFVTSVRTLPE